VVGLVRHGRANGKANGCGKGEGEKPSSVNREKGMNHFIAGREGRVSVRPRGKEGPAKPQNGGGGRRGGISHPGEGDRDSPSRRSRHCLTLVLKRREERGQRLLHEVGGRDRLPKW